jgi:hypothetical protein
MNDWPAISRPARDGRRGVEGDSDGWGGKGDILSGSSCLRPTTCNGDAGPFRRDCDSEGHLVGKCVGIEACCGGSQSELEELRTLDFPCDRFLPTS